MFEQGAPFTIQIEPTEGCNRGCSFCGLRGMREKGTEPFYFMKKEVAERIASQIAEAGWNSKILFAMHGEPTLNKNLVRIIKIFRKHLPKSQFSLFTNGVGIQNGTFSIQDLREAGINNLMIDLYAKGDDGHKIMNSMEPEEYEILGSGVPMFKGTHKTFRLLFAPPIQESKDTKHTLCNHCGAAAPLDFSCDGKRCARPFRELSFRYDGSVSICCNDFRGEYPIGNIMEMDIDDIWQDKKFRAARILLYAGKRTFTPCLGCNALSHRVGLLPDKMGKETMPEPTEKIEKFARSVAKNSEPLCGENWHKQKWED